MRAVILSIDTEKRKISFGLKPSYFEEKDFVLEESEDEDEDIQQSSPALGIVEDLDEGSNSDGGESAEDDVSSEEGEDESDNDSSENAVDMDVDLTLDLQTSATSAVPSAKILDGLQLDGGFEWSAPDPNEDVDMDSQDSGDDDHQGSKKKRKRKEIEQDLTAYMHSKAPESNADFERLLLGSPNSSYLWIQYMSFQLQLSEVDKAREIAKRALKTINFREEQEKLNVWIALLNLENVYGTDDSLEAAFKDAARHNDSKTIHLRLAEIFEQSDKPEVRAPFVIVRLFAHRHLQKAEEQYKRTCKKFSQSSKVWTLFGEHYLKRGMLEDARKLLPRSLQSLEKRKRKSAYFQWQRSF